jgi:hypothetical protein
MPQHMIPQKQLEGAKLYSSRYDFVKTLPTGITFLEAGVLAGDFAIEVIKYSCPSKSILIDPYEEIDWHAQEHGKPRWAGKEDHFDFVCKRFAQSEVSKMSDVEIIKGTYEDFCLKNNESFDFLYMDYNTTEESIIEQIELSIPRLNKNGILGFNDYNIYFNETRNGEKMGTVPAINRFLLQNPEWYVHAFALNDNLTSDIYLKKLT